MIWSQLYIRQWSYFRQLILQTTLYPYLGIIFIIFIQTKQFDWTKRTKNEKCCGGIKNWVETNSLRDCADSKPYRIFWMIQIKLSPRYMPKSTATRNEVYSLWILNVHRSAWELLQNHERYQAISYASFFRRNIFSVKAWF